MSDIQNMQTAGQALEEIRQNSNSKTQKGLTFERLCKELLESLPEYQFDKVENYSDLFGKDLGIDLVGTRKDGSVCAIQCKCFDPTHQVSKKDIDTFLAASGKKEYASRILIATCPWNSNAEKTIKDQRTPVQRIDFDTDLSHAKIEWDGTHPTIHPENRELLPLQEVAVQSSIAHFVKNKMEQGYLEMACGTGKTFTSLKISEGILGKGNGKAGSILFVAPSLALVSQAHKEWLRFRDPDRDMRTLIVCSDKSAGRAGSNDISPMELTAPPTTNAKELATQANAIPGRARTAIFCTYQSLGVVRDAQSKHHLPKFDIAIADEAHRTTGKIALNREGEPIYENFLLFHDRRRILAKRRLYMTATPRIYNAGTKTTFDAQHDKKEHQLLDMDNLDVYGEKIYHLGFRRAVRHDMLSDFKVIVLTMQSDDPFLQQQLLDPSLTSGKHALTRLTDDGTALGILMAVAGHATDEDGNNTGPLKRVVAFSSSIQRSRHLMERLNSETARTIFPSIVADHVDGKDTSLSRNRKFRVLRDPQSDVHVLGNAKLLTEGIDVPSLDAVVFADPKYSQPDIVQAVGRVMRRAPNKDYGYVIVPILLSGPELPYADIETQFNDKDFHTLWKVLAALRSHDEGFRIGQDIEKKLIVFSIKSQEVSKKETKPQNSLTGQPSSAHGVENLHIVTGRNLVKASEKFISHIRAKVLKQVGTNVYALDTAAQISSAVGMAANLLRKSELGQCLVPVLETEDDDSEDRQRTLTIATLMLFNGCLMQVLLEKEGNIKGISSLGDIRKGKRQDIPKRLIADWKLILERDYFPIYVLPAKILETLLETSSVQNPYFLQALVRLMNCAEQNASSIAQMDFDHAGPLYHKLLPSAESDGAFYTKNVSASLLAGLAMDEDFCDWKDPEAVKNLKIIDPAMGTGTLLMAALRRIKEMHANAMNDPDLEQDAKLHQAIVENCINGLDINSHAVQMAAMSLSLGATGTDYSKINLYTMPHGLQKDGTVRAGSLELLDQGDGQPYLELGSATPFGKNRTEDTLFDEARQVDQS